MTKQNKLFTIYPRKLKTGKTIFYYYIYTENGKRKNYSTGTENEIDAYKKCLELIKANKLEKKSKINIRKYCENWFLYDLCPYIQYKLLHGYTYSKSHCDNQRNILSNHIIPYFKSYDISDINSEDIESFIAYMSKVKMLSNTSINHSLSILSIILSWAKKHNDILNNPMESVMKLKSDTREKGVLSSSEYNLLLLSPNSLSNIWNNDYNTWLLNFTAYHTGCRLGELQALQRINIKESYLIIEYSWDRKYGLKTTKTGKKRIIPISKNLHCCPR